ncbi:MAG: signal peptide peptidase SppA [Phycisphaerales bacterium]|nr:signal peptide peptidase SppA [Phycisphaerales bacterium]
MMRSFGTVRGICLLLMMVGMWEGLAGCGRRVMRIDLVPVEERLTPEVIEWGDAGRFTRDRIAMIQVSGLIANTKASGLLSTGNNPVSDFRETLDAIARDPSVKAVVLRINSPGGTVTASDMMYKDLLEFKRKTNKPVVTCMMDVCASGGYYLSCASDYRVAYPTTITGSIGVIIETINLNGTLRKLGITNEAVKSGPNKDMGSPFKKPAGADSPLTANDRELLQAMVNQFYAGFREVVKKSPNRIVESDWPMVTDGRVLTGRDAAKLGLIDEVGDLDSAIRKAKELAKIERARIIMYTRRDEYRGSVYANSPTPSAQMNMINLNVDIGDLLPHGQSQFLYLWTGFEE